MGLEHRDDSDIEASNSAKLSELAKRRESKEVAPDDFDLINWLNYSDGRALTRQDLGNQAAVLDYDQFSDIQILTIKLPGGSTTDLDVDDLPPGSVLIIYPADLG